MNTKVCDLPVRYGDALFHLYISQQMPLLVSQVCPVHKHAYYELHMVLGGRRMYRVEGQQLELQEGEFLLLPPGTEHEPMDKHHPDYEILTLPFSLEQVTDTLSFYGLFEEALVTHSLLPVRAEKAMITQLAALASLPESLSAGTYCRLLAAGSNFICELMHTLHCFEENPITGADPFSIPEGLPALLDTLVHQQELPLRAIAQSLHYSERHTARLIRQIYHMTLSELRAQSAAGQNKEDIL